MAGSGREPQPQSQSQFPNQNDSDASEHNIQWGPRKAGRARQDIAGEDGRRRMKLIEGVSGPIEIARRGYSTSTKPPEIERVVQELEQPPSAEEAALHVVANPESQADNQSQLSNSAPPPTPHFPLEDGDPSDFIELLSEAVEFDPEEEAESPDEWDLSSEEWSQLPRSPLMDAAFLAARDKFGQPKSDPSKKRSVLQRTLEKNPFAIALASPVRRCMMTRVALPKYFLQNFGILGHPKTGEPFLIPRGMFNAKNTIQPSSLRMGSGMVGPGMYVLARYPLLRAMLSDTGGFGRDPYRKLFPTRMMKVRKAMNLVNQTKIREDMHDFVVEQARRRIVSCIIYLWGTKIGYMKAYPDWYNSRTWAKQVGAYMWTGSKHSDGAEEPPEFATVEPLPPGKLKDKGESIDGTKWRNRGKTPVYNLKVLLGEEKMEELRAGCPAKMLPLRGQNRVSLFDGPIVTLKRRAPTTSLELQLWWLQGYLAQHKNYLGDGS